MACVRLYFEVYGAGRDHDLIRAEHTMAIYEQIPNGQLAIQPNATHLVRFDDPGAFNAVVERFLRAPL